MSYPARVEGLGKYVYIYKERERERERERESEIEKERKREHERERERERESECEREIYFMNTTDIKNLILIRVNAVDASIRLKDYIQKHDGGLITAIRNDTDNTMDNRMTITREKMGWKTTLWVF